MAEHSKIEWTDHTFNPWIGCTKVSPGCDHCYAEAWDARGLQQKATRWGAHAARTRTSAANWRKPLAWNRAAKAAGRRARVFCASLADVFDNHPSILPEWRADLWALIGATTHLDWLLLTKRPQNIARYLPGDWGDGWRDVWIGTTVENQTEAERRIPHLLATPAAGRFLSCEPLLGPVDLEPWLPWPCGGGELPNGDSFGCYDCDAGNCTQCPRDRAYYRTEEGPRDADGCPEWITCDRQTVDWVICGGESGRGARPMHPDWARSLRDQCDAAGVPFFFKQWGAYSPDSDGSHRGRFPDHTFGGTGPAMFRLGKRDAGCTLDGRTWDHTPGRAR